ncbi:MAG: hypothetical protein ACI9MR_000008 [Myxococcota bacterium]|jgi:hypothetical protein
MPTFRAEQFLAIQVPVTGDLEVSETADSGPWTTISLTTAAGLSSTTGVPLTEALTAWAVLATAALAETYTFSWSDSTEQVTLSATGSAWVQMSQTQADMLGFVAPVQTLNATSVAGASLGVASVRGIQITPPKHTAAAQLYEYRGGRHSSYHHSRLETVNVEVICDEAQWNVLGDEAQLLRAGRQRLSCGDPATAYAPGSYDGYLDVDPIAGSLSYTQVEGASAGAEMFLGFRASMEVA